jgi:transcription initiation factor TFIIE subunit alpha
MEKAQVLVRQVARAFYTTDQVVVIDALVNHVAVNVEELRRIFVSTGRNKNELLKLLGPLREAALVSMYAIDRCSCLLPVLTYRQGHA